MSKKSYNNILIIPDSIKKPQKEIDSWIELYFHYAFIKIANIIKYY